MALNGMHPKRGERTLRGGGLRCAGGVIMHPPEPQSIEANKDRSRLGCRERFEDSTVSPRVETVGGAESLIERVEAASG
jgi:hypothetical protein